MQNYRIERIAALIAALFLFLALLGMPDGVRSFWASLGAPLRDISAGWFALVGLLTGVAVLHFGYEPLGRWARRYFRDRPIDPDGPTKIITMVFAVLSVSISYAALVLLRYFPWHRDDNRQLLLTSMAVLLLFSLVLHLARWVFKLPWYLYVRRWDEQVIIRALKDGTWDPAKHLRLYEEFKAAIEAPDIDLTERYVRRRHMEEINRLRALGAADPEEFIAASKGDVELGRTRLEYARLKKENTLREAELDAEIAEQRARERSSRTRLENDSESEN